MPYVSMSEQIAFTAEACSISTTLGTPVDPEVATRYARSLGVARRGDALGTPASTLDGCCVTASNAAVSQSPSVAGSSLPGPVITTSGAMRCSSILISAEGRAGSTHTK
jgi:hypothetical protein